MKRVFLGALLLALTACTPALGHNTDTAPPTEKGGTVPHCPQVFKIGRTLPDPFYGCMPAYIALGADSGPMPTVCLDGRILFVWQDYRWAFPGQPVKPLTWKNDDYALAVRDCTGVMPVEPTP